MKTLVLASSSRYRRELLGRLGLAFETLAPTVDESEHPGEPPEDLANRLAAAKAQAVVRPGTLVIGSDQVPSLDGRILRKPGDHQTALRQLEACQGRSVDFFTAVCLLDADSGRRWQHRDLTRVIFRRQTSAVLNTYLESERPYDCAGGFKAEGLGIALFERIESSDPTALIGLPLIWLAHALRQAGMDPLSSSIGQPARREPL